MIFQFSRTFQPWVGLVVGVVAVLVLVVAMSVAVIVAVVVVVVVVVLISDDDYGDGDTCISTDTYLFPKEDHRM